jgi:hypothetical protein
MSFELTAEGREWLEEIMELEDYEREIDAIEVGLRLLRDQLRIRASIRELAARENHDDGIEVDERFWDELDDEMDEMDEAEARRVLIVRKLVEARDAEKSQQITISKELWTEIDRDFAIIEKYDLPHDNRDVLPPLLRRVREGAGSLAPADQG